MINSTIRTAQNAVPNYEEYLKTPEWRKRRNAFLGRKGWHCERCGRKVDLQVHHRSYARLGSERDEDLEALCRDCHEGHHYSYSQQTNIGVYIKLVEDTIATERYETLGDLTEAVNIRCAKLKIPYNNHQIQTAMSLIGPKRIPLLGRQVAPVALWKPRETPAIGKDEAREICRRLGLIVALPSIPAPASFTWKQTEDEWMNRDERDKVTL